MPQLLCLQDFVCFFTLYLPCEGDASCSSFICGFAAFSVHWIFACWSTELCFWSKWVEWFLFDWIAEIEILPACREGYWCFQQLMVYPETCTVFSFQLFSFLSGHCNALMSSAVYNEGISVWFELILAGECLYRLTCGTSLNGLLIQRTNLKSGIITWSAILNQDCLLTSHSFVLMVLIPQNWLHSRKQHTISSSGSPQQPLCLSSGGWIAKGAALEK